MNEPRVRIAPSPTGFLHIGTARTALFNWLFAQKHNGAFIVRIEDTDKERSQSEFENDILEGFAWLGLGYDELYRQSERLEIHKKFLKKLIGEGKAFFCPHSFEELQEETKKQRETKEPQRHICPKRESKDTEKGIIRFKNNEISPITVHDIIRGTVSYQAQLLGDFSLAKSFEEPLYNFAAVIDDSELKISHIIRGEDHLSNTPKQILIGRALGFQEPQWAHLPLLLGMDRSKLSKRHGALAIRDYQHAGYLPEAFINFIALLGWHPRDEIGEILDRDTIIKEFSLEKVQKGGAIVSSEKLDWLNRQHLQKFSLEVFTRRILDFTQNTKSLLPQELFVKAAPYLKARITKLSDAAALLKEINEPPTYSKELLLWQKKLDAQSTKDILNKVIEILSAIKSNEFELKVIEKELKPIINKNSRGDVLWPLRVALSGKETSWGPYELCHVIGKDESLRRLQKAKEKFYEK